MQDQLFTAPVPQCWAGLRIRGGFVGQHYGDATNRSSVPDSRRPIPGVSISGKMLDDIDVSIGTRSSRTMGTIK